MDFSQLWFLVVDNVAKETVDPNEKMIYQMLRSQVSLRITDDTINFLCSSPYILNMMNSRPDYLSRLFNEISHLINRDDLKIEVNLASAENNQVKQQTDVAQNVFNGVFGQNLGNVPPSQIRTAAVNQISGPTVKPDFNKYIRQSPINADKTFENYVTDPENELIYNIAKRVAADPGSSSTNPFYIYGGSGLGKTHLLFAIANRIRTNKPQINLVYTRAEEFIRTYVDSVSRKNSYDYQQIHFQDLYTQQDVIIVDDIQNFIGAPKSRDAFFDIIAEFLEIPGRQLILASDVPPGNLKDFSPRLKSRFGSGVCREIYPPSSETRAAITLNKCREFKVNLSDDVVNYIATHIRSNVREIEGAIKTLNMYIQQYGSITLEKAKLTLANMVQVSGQGTTIDEIKARVAKEYDVTVPSMESAERKKMVSLARSMAMALAQELIPNLSLNDIGRAFNKDHSSVHEAIKRIKSRIDSEEEIGSIYHKLTLSLKKE